jgi:hypothetical protein
VIRQAHRVIRRQQHSKQAAVPLWFTAAVAVLHLLRLQGQVLMVMLRCLLCSNPRQNSSSSSSYRLTNQLRRHGTFKSSRRKRLAVALRLQLVLQQQKAKHSLHVLLLHQMLQ